MIDESEDNIDYKKSRFAIFKRAKVMKNQSGWAVAPARDPEVDQFFKS